MPPIRSLAVLPFRPLIAGQADEALELGMADTLIARLREVRVRPITAVRKYAGREQDAVAAGREQGVDAVLDGHIQKAGETVRVTVRLVRVADKTPLWTDQLDTPMTGIFAVQDKVAERVAAALAVRLTGEQKARLSVTGDSGGLSRGRGSTTTPSPRFRSLKWTPISGPPRHLRFEAAPV